MSLTVKVHTFGDQWIAECAEYDLVAQASSLDDVIYEFERTLSVQIAMDINAGINPLSEIRK